MRYNANTLPTLLRGNLPSSLSATKQHIKAKTKDETRRWWRRSARYKHTRKIDPSLPSKEFIEATSELSCNQTSLLTQLRTGHIPLNQHLHRIGRSDTPHCQHCPGTIEDVPHLILFCNRHAHHRHKLTTALGRKAHELSHLLANAKAIRHTLNFLSSTRRFEHLYGDISMSLRE